jgi:hypothetical protein
VIHRRPLKKEGCVIRFELQSNLNKNTNTNFLCKSKFYFCILWTAHEVKYIYIYSATFIDLMSINLSIFGCKFSSRWQVFHQFSIICRPCDFFGCDLVTLELFYVDKLKSLKPPPPPHWMHRVINCHAVYIYMRMTVSLWKLQGFMKIHISENCIPLPFLKIIFSPLVRYVNIYSSTFFCLYFCPFLHILFALLTSFSLHLSPFFLFLSHFSLQYFSNSLHIFPDVKAANLCFLLSDCAKLTIQAGGNT